MSLSIKRFELCVPTKELSNVKKLIARIPHKDALSNGGRSFMQFATKDEFDSAHKLIKSFYRNEIMKDPLWKNWSGIVDSYNQVSFSEFYFTEKKKIQV